MRVSKSCLIWQLCVNKGKLEMLSSLVVISIREGSTSVGFSRETTLGWLGESGWVTSANRVWLVQMFLSARQCTNSCELVLWKVHEGAFLGMDGDARETRECLVCEGLEIEGTYQVGGEWIWGATLRSMAKARRKVLSKEGDSNKSTSRRKIVNKPELNFIINTSYGSKMSSWMPNLQKTSM